MRLTYAGRDLLYEPPNNELAVQLEQFQPLDWFDYSPHPYADHGKSLHTYNWRPVPNLKLNQLYLPTGATRHGIAFVMATEADYTQILATVETGVGIKNRAGAALEVFDEYGNVVFNGQFWMLKERVFFNQSPKLYILPLVDERYWWQFRQIDQDPVADNWQQTFENYFDINTSDVPAIHGNYGQLNEDDLKGHKSGNFGILLDGMAASLNFRVLYDYAANKPILKRYDDDAAQGNPLAVNNYPHHDYGGPGGMVIPRKAKFYFRNEIDGELQADHVTREYDFSTQSAQDWVKVSPNPLDFVAFFPGLKRIEDTTAGTDNDTELDDYADRYAQDWFEWQRFPFDFTYAGLLPEEDIRTGWNDCIIYDLGRRAENANLEGKLRDDEPEPDKLLAATRVISWPHDVINPQMTTPVPSVSNLTDTGVDGRSYVYFDLTSTTQGVGGNTFPTGVTVHNKDPLNPDFTLSGANQLIFESGTRVHAWVDIHLEFEYINYFEIVSNSIYIAPSGGELTYTDNVFGASVQDYVDDRVHYGLIPAVPARILDGSYKWSDQRLSTPVSGTVYSGSAAVATANVTGNSAFLNMQNFSWRMRLFLLALES